MHPAVVAALAVGTLTLAACTPKPPPPPETPAQLLGRINKLSQSVADDATAGAEEFAAGNGAMGCRYGRRAIANAEKVKAMIRELPPEMQGEFLEGRQGSDEAMASIRATCP